MKQEDGRDEDERPVKGCALHGDLEQEDLEQPATTQTESEMREQAAARRNGGREQEARAGGTSRRHEQEARSSSLV